MITKEIWINENSMGEQIVLKTIIKLPTEKYIDREMISIDYVELSDEQRSIFDKLLNERTVNVKYGDKEIEMFFVNAGGKRILHCGKYFYLLPAKEDIVDGYEISWGFSEYDQQPFECRLIKEDENGNKHNN